MTRASRGTWIFAASLSILPFAGGCGGDQAGPASAPAGAAGQPGPNPGGREPGGPEAGGKSVPEIKAIMVKLAKGPTSLTPMLGKELKAAEPAWETIQGQTKEFAQLAADLAKYDPPKGTKESWTKLTGEYSALASELDKDAQAKDKDAAAATQEKLSNSCMTCHRQHRVMGPGMGGPPGGGMMGRPGGPGGPGGPGSGGSGGPPGGEPPK